MRKILSLAGAAALLAACQTSYTPEGCAIRYGQVGAAQTRACVAAYHQEKARQSGASVTRCFETASGMTCLTE